MIFGGSHNLRNSGYGNGKSRKLRLNKKKVKASQDRRNFGNNDEDEGEAETERELQLNRRNPNRKPASPVSQLWKMSKKGRDLKNEYIDEEDEFGQDPHYSTAPTKNCFLSWLCFCELNYLFNRGAQRRLTISDLEALPPDLRAENVSKKIQEIESKLKKSKGKPVDDVADIIFPVVTSKLVFAVILQALQHLITVVLHMITKHFLPQIKLPDDQRNLYIMFSCPILAFFLTLLQALVGEHTQKYICQAGAMASMIMRTKLFEKLSTASYTFLKNVDSSVLVKLSLYEFGMMTDMISRVPHFFNFPILFLFSVYAMVQFISYMSLVLLFIFLIGWMILLAVIKNLAIHNLKNMYYSSKRSSLLGEILGKFKHMKQDSMEYYLYQRVKDIRNREMTAFGNRGFLNCVINFVLSVIPLICTVVIIMLEHHINQVHLDIASTFTLVSLIYSMKGPMGEFVSFYIEWKGYNHAKTCINNLFYVINDKPDCVEHDQRLSTGSIIINNCSAELENDAVMQETLISIFGGNLDVDSETRKLKLRLTRLRAVAERSRGNERKVKLRQLQQETAQYQTLEQAQNLRPAKTLRQLKQMLNQHHTIVNHEINLSISPGEKICMIGEDDSGLNEFIQTLFGETTISRGYVKVKGRIVIGDGDNPFFQIGKSLRDNILMCEAMHTERYTKVLRIVKLDIRRFLGADMIEVLSDGLNFSEMEKVKIQLARALYSPAEIYILKGIFGREMLEDELDLFDSIIKGALSNKVVLYTSRDDTLMKDCDRIVLFDRGKMHDLGGYQSYKALQLLIAQMKSSNIEEALKRLQAGELDDEEEGHFNSILSIESALRFHHQARISDPNRLQKQKQQERVTSRSKSFTQTVKKYLKDDKVSRVHGRFTHIYDDTEVYRNLFSMAARYIFLKGKARVFCMLFIFFISMLLFVGMDIYTGVWISKLIPSFTMNHYLLAYLVLSLVASLSVLIRDKRFAGTFGPNAILTHDRLLSKMMNMKLKWFTEYPGSGIGFKMAYDILKVETAVNGNIHSLFESFVYTLGGLVLVNFVYKGLMLIPTLIFIVYMYYVISNFKKTTTPLVRFIAENTAKMGALYGRCIDSMTKYRAFGKTELLRREYCVVTNQMQRTLGHLGYSANRWLGMRALVLNSFLIGLAYTIPIITSHYLKGYFHRPLIEYALAISWSLKTIGHLEQIVNSLLGITENIVSFGRIEYLTRRIHSEDTNKGRVDLSKSVAYKSAVEFEKVNLTLVNRRVLQGASFELVKREAMAVAGESGSGRHCMFSLIEKIFEVDRPEDGEKGVPFGKISVAGYNLNEINSQEARMLVKHLSDTPVTFSGVVRDNIDSNYFFKDEQILDVLVKLNAAEIIQPTHQAEKSIKRSARSSRRRISLSGTKKEGADRLEISQSKTGTMTSVPNQKSANTLKQFLYKEVTDKSSQFPLRVRRLIKLAKVVLENPHVLLIDQKALDLGYLPFAATFKNLKSMLPATSMMVIISDYEDILLFKRTLVLKSSKIAELDFTESLLLEKESELTKIAQNADYLTYLKLYRTVGGEERDKELVRKIEEEKRRREKKRIEEKMRQKFRNSLTDLKSMQAYEYTLQTLNTKILRHKDFNQSPQALQLSSIPEQISRRSNLKSSAMPRSLAQSNFRDRDVNGTLDAGDLGAGGKENKRPRGQPLHQGNEYVDEIGGGSGDEVVDYYNGSKNGTDTLPFQLALSSESS